MDKGEKLGALSSLMASYAGGEDDSEDEEVAEDEGEVPSRQLASEILESVVTTALEGKRPADAFTAVQEPSSSEGSDTDDDDSGNEESNSPVHAVSTYKGHVIRHTFGD